MSTVAVFMAANASTMSNKNVGPGFLLEWYELKSETYASMQPFLQVLEPVFVASFSAAMKPYIYAHDQRLVNVSVEQQSLIEQQIAADIVKFLQSLWEREIVELYDDLQSKKSSVVYIVVAKDEQQRPRKALQRRFGCPSFIENLSLAHKIRTPIQLFYKF